MQTIKHTYANMAHAIGSVAPIRRWSDGAVQSDAFGLGRWLASLLAIHDVARMVQLDCPWWNVAATRHIVAFLRARPNARVFEYGSGASTVWLARRAKEVISVEHDQRWMGKVHALLRGFGNASLLNRERDAGAYSAAIDEFPGTFDLIVVDGRDRTACLSHAVTRLAPGGIVLFDDSGRRRYRTAIAACGLKERRFFGRSFCVPYPDHTSILAR
jgi:SAM-dependent methyltransferase